MNKLEMEKKINNILFDIINKKHSDNNSFLTIDDYKNRIFVLKNENIQNWY